MKVTENFLCNFLKDINLKLNEKDFAIHGKPVSKVKRDAEGMITSIARMKFVVKDIRCIQGSKYKYRQMTLKAVLGKYFTDANIYRNRVAFFQIEIHDVLEGKTKQMLRKKFIQELLDED